MPAILRAETGILTDSRTDATQKLVDILNYRNRNDDPDSERRCFRFLAVELLEHLRWQDRSARLYDVSHGIAIQRNGSLVRIAGTPHFPRTMEGNILFDYTSDIPLPLGLVNPQIRPYRATVLARGLRIFQPVPYSDTQNLARAISSIERDWHNQKVLYSAQSKA